MAQPHDRADPLESGPSRSDPPAAARPPRPASGSARRRTARRCRRRRRDRRARSSRSSRASARSPARPNRQTPPRSPDDRDTRQESVSSDQARSIVAIVTPACSGRPGPGEITMRSGLRRAHFLDGHRVVAQDANLRAELAQVLDEVVGKRVVVVDDDDHRPCCASSSARTSARALSRVSSYSAVGFESITMPAPACT